PLLRTLRRGVLHACSAPRRRVRGGEGPRPRREALRQGRVARRERAEWGGGAAPPTPHPPRRSARTSACSARSLDGCSPSKKARSSTASKSAFACSQGSVAAATPVP